MSLIVSRLYHNNLNTHAIAQQLADDFRLLDCKEEIQYGYLKAVCEDFLYEPTMEPSLRFIFGVSLLRTVWLLVNSDFMTAPVFVSTAEIKTMRDVRYNCEFALDIRDQIKNKRNHEASMKIYFQYAQFLDTYYSFMEIQLRSEGLKLLQLLLTQAHIQADTRGETCEDLELIMFTVCRSDWRSDNEIAPECYTKYSTVVNQLFYFFRFTHTLEARYHNSPILTLFAKCINDYQKYKGMEEYFGVSSRKTSLVSVCKLLITALRKIREPNLLSQLIEKLIELDLAYELRSKQEYSRDQQNLMPSCLELAFPTPLDDIENPEYICEFAYFRDTLDHLRRRRPARYQQLIEKLDSKYCERLHYYLYEYDRFDRCCSSYEAKQVKFICVGHTFEEEFARGETKVCHLLNRQFSSCRHIPTRTSEELQLTTLD